MYQLDHRPFDELGTGVAASSSTEASFLRACTSTMPTPANLALVRNTAALMRVALYDGNLAPLRDVVTLTAEWNVNAADIFAAAQQLVVDSLAAASASAINATWKRLTAISNDVLPVMPFDGSFLEVASAQQALVG